MYNAMLSPCKDCPCLKPLYSRSIPFLSSVSLISVYLPQRQVFTCRRDKCLPAAETSVWRSGASTTVLKECMACTLPMQPSRDTIVEYASNLISGINRFIIVGAQDNIMGPAKASTEIA